MKFFIASAFALTLALSASAASIPVCSTGWNNTCTAELASGLAEPNYLLAGGDFVSTNVPGVYVADNATSKWISPGSDGSANQPTGTYTYTTTFTIGGASAASISGNWAVDNTATMSLNGHLISTISNPSGFGAFTAFSDSTLSDFVAGVNTLTFVVSNAGSSPNPTGLNVQISGNFTPTAPEPVSMFLFGSGLVAMSVIGRRKFGRK